MRPRRRVAPIRSAVRRLLPAAEQERVRRWQRRRGASPEEAATAGDTTRSLLDGGPGQGGADATPDADDGAARHGASREESLAATDFRDLHRPDQMREIETLMRRFARRLKHVRLRREARRRSGRRLDLPITIRRSIGSGGTPFRLAWKDRRRVRPRLVLLLDVSRSMSAYSFFYLRLARALAAALEDVHCFIFHTRITGVGEALRDRTPGARRNGCTSCPPAGVAERGSGNAWKNGTAATAPAWCTRVPAVIIVSDGYDTGSPSVSPPSSPRSGDGHGASCGSIHCWAGPISARGPRHARCAPAPRSLRVRARISRASSGCCRT